MSVFVPYTEQEPGLLLAEFLQQGPRAAGEQEQKSPEAQAALERFQRHLEQQNITQFLRDLLPIVTNKLPSLNAREAETVLQVVLSYTTLLRSQNPQQGDELALQIFNLLLSDAQDKPAIRVAMAAQVYNGMSSSPSAQCSCLQALVSYAVRSEQWSMLSSQLTLPTVLAAIRDWKADVPTSRRILLDIANAHMAAHNESEVHKFLVQFLMTYQNADSAALDSVKEQAAMVSVLSLKLPQISYCDDLLEMSAVAVLQNDSVHGRLFNLLKAFQNAQLDTYSQLYHNNEQYFNSLGLDHDLLLKKIRLLALSDLVAKYEEIPYATIAESLKLDLEEVEDWVIDAVAADLIEAKMDQHRRVITISRYAQRVFTADQWRQLHQRLTSWRDDIRSLLDLIGNANALKAAAQQQQQQQQQQQI